MGEETTVSVAPLTCRRPTIGSARAAVNEAASCRDLGPALRLPSTETFPGGYRSGAAPPVWRCGPGAGGGQAQGVARSQLVSSLQEPALSKALLPPLLAM